MFDTPAEEAVRVITADNNMWDKTSPQKAKPQPSGSGSRGQSTRPGRGRGRAGRYQPVVAEVTNRPKVFFS